MEIRKVERDKKQYLDLLLLADEQEDMIDRYLERGTMYVLEDDGVRAECVVTDEGDGHHLVKNFFTDHYDHPIYECGVQLVDMVYLRRKLEKSPAQ